MSKNRFSPYEFALVIGIAFGWSIVGSVTTFVHGQTVGVSPSGFTFGPTHLYGVIIFELMVTPVIGAVLYARGWRLSDFPVRLGKVETLLGVAIFLGAWALGYLFSLAMSGFFDSAEGALSAYHPSRSPSLVAIYLLSVVNPVFEEVIVCGYVIPAIESRFGTTTAVNVSAIIRGSYHLYQGITAAPFHFSYGLIQAYVFVRLRNLWPLIVSHALDDFVALLFIA